MSEKIVTQKDNLTCHNHGGNEATKVCGNCGDPLCEECQDSAYDPTFATFVSGAGGTRFILVVLLIIGVPLSYDPIIGKIVQQIRFAIAPTHGFYAASGLIPLSILVGFAMALNVWFDEKNPFSPPFWVRQGNERTLCEDCISQASRRAWFTRGIAGFAVLIMLFGVYRIIMFKHLAPLGIVGLGAAVYLLKDDLFAIGSTITGSSEESEDVRVTSEWQESEAEDTFDDTASGDGADTDGDTQYCSTCGAEHPAGASFCSECGSEL